MEKIINKSESMIFIDEIHPCITMNHIQSDTKNTQGVAVGTVALTRHAFNWDVAPAPGVAELQWPPKWQFPVASLCGSVVLAVILVLLPEKIRVYASPLVCGSIFGASTVESLMCCSCVCL